MFTGQINFSHIIRRNNQCHDRQTDSQTRCANMLKDWQTDKSTDRRCPFLDLFSSCANFVSHQPERERWRQREWEREWVVGPTLSPKFLLPETCQVLGNKIKRYVARSSEQLHNFFRPLTLQWLRWRHGSAAARTVAYAGWQRQPDTCSWRLCMHLCSHPARQLVQPARAAL